eukprot:3015526-Rhodomonas_salina.1
MSVPTLIRDALSPSSGQQACLSIYDRSNPSSFKELRESAPSPWQGIFIFQLCQTTEYRE